MILTDIDIENLDNYWHNQLPEIDRLAMENRLKTDADFRQAADEMRLITEGLEVVRLRQMKARLTATEATLPEIEIGEPTNWPKIALITLVLAAATFATWYFIFREKPTPPPKVPTEIVAYFEPYVVLGLTMSGTKDDRKKEARIAYAEAKYAQAIPLLDASFNETQDSMQLFYKGIAHLAIGEATAAQTVFEQLEQAQTVPHEAAKWYLALSYVATKQYDKARILLQNTASDAYKEKAERLLKEISEKK